MKRFFFSALLSMFLLKICAIEITSGPYLQNVGENEATIMWRTDKAGTAWVEIAPDDSSNFYSCERPRIYETYLGRAVIGTMHKVTLRNLTPATTYRYRVFSEEVLEQQPYHVSYGEIASTNVYLKKPLEFTTMAAGKPEIRFKVVNDIHGDNDKLDDLLGDVAGSGYDFVVYNGDMVNFMGKEDDLFNGFINRSTELFASEKAFFMARGNHETRGNWAENYMNYFPTPTGKPYYSFKTGPVFFIVLDGGEDKPDNDIEYSRTSFFDDYRTEEALWLKELLASDEFKNSPFKIVVTHVPPINDNWHGPLHAKELFLPLLNEAGIDLMLCGHTHEYAYCPKGTDGAQFPLLINSDSEVLDISSDKDVLKVAVIDRNGKVVRTFKYASSLR